MFKGLIDDVGDWRGKWRRLVFYQRIFERSQSKPPMNNLPFKSKASGYHIEILLPIFTLHNLLLICIILRSD
jgi:hypothetical protein